MLRAMSIVILLLVVPATARAFCGDGVLEPGAGEQCEPNLPESIGTPAECCSATCQLVDADGDGICDDRDVCERSTTADTTEVTLRVRGVPLPVGNERMRFSGRFRFESSDFVDPAIAGLRFSLHGEVSTDAETRITPMIAARIPGGAGWRSSNGRWHFRDSKGLDGGITTVTLKAIMPAPLVPPATPVCRSRIASMPGAAATP